MSGRDVLVLAETQFGELSDITHQLLGAAQPLAEQLGGQTVALLLGPNAADNAGALAADRVLVIEDEHLTDFSPWPYLTVLEHVIRSESPRAVLIGSTSIGLDIAPALAAMLEAPMVNGCQRIAVENDSLLVTANFFAGKLLADLRIERGPAILLVMPGSFRPTEQSGRPEVEVRPSPVPLESGAITFEEMILPEAGDVDIMQQDVLVAVGRGIEQEDNLELAEDLANVLDGQLAASRPIVDQGWLPTARQVGKSGMIVHPKLYLALGISGAPEHEEGMAGSDLIVAINTDPAAPIFDVAHYGVQMDLFDLVPALTEALQKRQRKE